MRCYRDKGSRSGPFEALYFAKEFDHLPRAMREADLFEEIILDDWDLDSVHRAVAQSGWTVRFRRQMNNCRAAAE